MTSDRETGETAPGSAGRPLRVLGFAGSLRLGSYNRAALRAAVELAPEGMVVETFEIAGIPLYSADTEAGGLPGPVEEMSARVTAADAVLIVTPEYNYSIPGVLKNAIDWCSRHPQKPFAGKPVAIMGASAGNLGTVRAQMHLRQVFVFLNVIPLNKPEVFIARAHEKFDGEGRLVDQTTRAQIRALLEALAAWTRTLRRD